MMIISRFESLQTFPSNLKAVRKAKFFLHPDKLPKDLTDNQSTLFKTLWDVIHEKSGS